MVIALTPDIESALAEEARRQGTTPEQLALDYLRERFVPGSTSPSAMAKTMADFLEGHIGVLASAERVSGGGQMSEDTGKRFATGLVENRRQGRL
jgi:hypothetical protein